MRGNLLIKKYKLFLPTKTPSPLLHRSLGPATWPLFRLCQMTFLDLWTLEVELFFLHDLTQLWNNKDLILSEITLLPTHFPFSRLLQTGIRCLAWIFPTNHCEFVLRVFSQSFGLHFLCTVVLCLSSSSPLKWTQFKQSNDPLVPVVSSRSHVLSSHSIEIGDIFCFLQLQSFFLYLLMIW